MEKLVIYRDNQELQADDFLNQQGWAQEALDHIVSDAINTDKAYSGFALTKAAATTIKASSGRLYVGGIVYAREDEVSIDLYNQLPVTAKKYFAIVAWGQSVDEDIQPRNYLIDADTGMAEPQSVAMQRTRYCNVSSVAGTESASPQFPSVEATYCLIGYVLCDPAGIVSYIQSTDTQLDNLEIIAARVATMEAWRSVAQGMIDTLRTDLANLANSLLNYTLLTQFQQLVDIVNELWELAHRPAPTIYQYYGNDRFLEDGLSETAGTQDGQYAARVEEGLRFPGGGVGWIGKLQLGNPSEQAIMSYDGFVLPKPSGSRIRYDCSFPDRPWTPVRILSWQFWNYTVVRHLTPSRWRFRWGPLYVPYPPASVWWFEAQRDPSFHILQFTNETPWPAQIPWATTVVHNEVGPYFPRHGYDRWKYYWRDWVETSYWARVYTNAPHSGNHGAQVFYNAQGGWLSGVTLFSHRQLYEPLSMVISGCTTDGSPDHENHTLRQVELTSANLQTCYETPIYAGDIIAQDVELTTIRLPGSIGGAYRTYARAVYHRVPTYIWPVRINFPPVFLDAGQHYAFHVFSTADHEFSFCDHDDAYQVVQGHFWSRTGMGFVVWASGPRVMRHLLHFATWGRWGDQPSPGGQLRYEIELEPLQLAGGIGAIDVLSEMIIPAATDLHFEVLAGGKWQPFDQDSSVLNGGDFLLRFRVVMNGTTDLMPGFSLTNSEVELTKGAATAMHHISKAISIPGGTQRPRVSLKLLNFNDATQDCVVKYWTTGPAVTGTDADEIMDDGTIVRTTTFPTMGAPATSFRVIIHGANTTPGVTPFVVGERAFYAVSS